MVTKGMLLVGHGSTMPYNKELIESTGKLIAAQTSEFVVKCGFMNINKPSIKDSLAEFKKENIDVLVVVPLFLAKGVHIEKTFPLRSAFLKAQRRVRLHSTENPFRSSMPIPSGSTRFLPS